MPDTKRCPYCAEEIRDEAVRCRYCRSRLSGFDVGQWHRGHEEARIGGVCAALSHAFYVPVSLVRVAFIVLGFFHLLGLVAYAALWLVIPPTGGQPSLLEDLLERVARFVRSLRGANGEHGGSAGPPSPTAHADAGSGEPTSRP